MKLFDPNRSQKSPILDMEGEEYPTTVPSFHHNGLQVEVGNRHDDNTALPDLPKEGHQVHSFKDMAGKM